MGNNCFISILTTLMTKKGQELLDGELKQRDKNIKNNKIKMLEIKA